MRQGGIHTQRMSSSQGHIFCLFCFVHSDARCRPSQLGYCTRSSGTRNPGGSCFVDAGVIIYPLSPFLQPPNFSRSQTVMWPMTSIPGLPLAQALLARNHVLVFPGLLVILGGRSLVACDDHPRPMAFDLEEATPSSEDLAFAGVLSAVVTESASGELPTYPPRRSSLSRPSV